MTPTTPVLCACGCGEPAPIAKKNDARQGMVKGRPQKYVRGHSRRNNRPEYLVDPETGCWEWQWFKDHRGYGKRAIKQPDGTWRWFYAHRLFYVRKFGPIPTGRVLDHLCRNPGCCNPDHVEIVTQRENVYRGSGTRLSDEQIHEAWQRIQAGEGLRAVARSMGATHGGLAYRFKRMNPPPSDPPDYPQP